MTPRPGHALLDGRAARPLAPQIIDLYNACYSRPPWNETPAQLADYPASLDASLDRPGFTAHVAFDPGGGLAGLCYGWPSPADLPANQIYDAIVRVLGTGGAAALTRGAFEVAELFVRPDARGHGHGRRLLTDAVTGWPAAWLITSPRTPAADLYRHLGWREGASLPRELYPPLPLSIFTLAGPPER
ncbi:GNAT family N-acetyltransferase [Actinomadura hibisca]|uniref:GNAT family N-acetyltransferase n=1 Tax=Actinomadura hibisca TaxID=68565 RepID=UPI0008315970|nr:GNAT family N-acetyltransferase [Actinomadura hibisca]